jgi:pimeloyl-ACP methyl ester carboxylesterase
MAKKTASNSSSKSSSKAPAKKKNASKKTKAAVPVSDLPPQDEVGLAAPDDGRAEENATTDNAPFATTAGTSDEVARESSTESAHAHGVNPDAKTRREETAGDRTQARRLELPYGGELVPADKKLREETIVFVHHFGGSPRTVTRHLDLVNSLGFDAVRFNLLFNDVKPMTRLPITANLRFGARHVWAEQIESILNAIPGRKILYSFSMPSAAALDALARRQANDVAGWICDGGPFLQLPRCVWNLYTHEYGLRSRILRSAATGASLVLFGVGLEFEVGSMLKRLPKNFPVLSIRGWRDPLVPPSAIDEVFSQQDHLDLETLALAEGKHLDGIKFFREEYTARLQRFLNRI